MYFQSRWGDYTKATKLVGPDRVLQLLECCDEQLRRDLTRNAGGTLAGGTEEEVLAAMKALAVREENVMVAQVALHHMKQDRDEPIRAFAARLKGQASVCKYVKTCPGCDQKVMYTEAILTDVLCRGIADAEIQMDLLEMPTKQCHSSKPSSSSRPRRPASGLPRGYHPHNQRKQWEALTESRKNHRPATLTSQP